jgi:hypothetical protein
VGIAITIVVVGALLFAYTIVEKRISQRACPSCGARVSKDAPEGCSSCGAQLAVGSLPGRRWRRFAFVSLAALCIVLTGAAVVFLERPRTETDKAIRLVQESRSRIENFTIQQYLYTTVYKQKDDGEPVTIGGWRAEQPDGPHTKVVVQFGFDTDGTAQVAAWEVDSRSGRVTPTNQVARDWSWNY